MPTIERFGDVDDRAYEQLLRCAAAGDAPAAVICADGHVGYSQPIGGAIGYRDLISPSGVGYDIACGNKAVRTNIAVDELAQDLGPVMDEISTRISFGVGRVNNEPADHQVLDKIRTAAFAPQRELYDTAAKQLGTVGAGNHYVDLFAGDDGWVWVGVHFGSRGFGHKTASGFLALAQGLGFDERARDGEMDSPPVLLGDDSALGQAYIEAMQLAGDYAYAGRDLVVEKVLEILGARTVYSVHNHHNFAWREKHGDEWLWVIRKGCTPAFPGQAGFVGATMGEESVVLEGVDHELAARSLYSTVHGAGRVMSRTQAAGKMGKAAECAHRDCDYWVRWAEYQAGRAKRSLGEHEPLNLCPDHGPGGRMLKRRRRIREGAIDFAQARAQLEQAGVELRGGAADEAPLAYKRLDEVLAAHADTIRVTHRLRPIGVAMAAPDTFDPYKD